MAAFAQFYVTYVSPVVRYGLTLVAMLGLWIALWRAGITPRARVIGIVITALLLVWWLATDQVGRSGFYPPNWGIMRPLGWIIAIACLVPLLRSQTIGSALDTIPAWWLVAIQVYRFGGGVVWLSQWSAGRLPDAFGLAAGIGDGLTGIVAAIAAVWLISGVRGGRIVAMGWNVFGIADFATGFVLASFFPYTVPYPAVMIPAFLAPLSLIFYGLSLRQLTRAIKRESGAAAPTGSPRPIDGPYGCAPAGLSTAWCRADQTNALS
jgi:hypothetical protein